MNPVANFMPETIRIVDRRNKEKFFMDDEYLNGYARLCGPHATLVYVSLCRHSNKSQIAFPSLKQIASEVAIGERSVKRGIAKLIVWNVISKKKTRTNGGVWLNNTYTLLDKCEWKPKPEAHMARGTRGLLVPNQGPESTKYQGPLGPTKEPHRAKELHNKELGNVLDKVRKELTQKKVL